MPAPLAEKPVVDVEGASLLDVFHNLSRSRVYGDGGPQAIPYVEILAWCSLMGVDDLDTRRRMAKLVRALDSIWLEAAHQRMAREIEAQRRKQGRR